MLKLSSYLALRLKIQIQYFKKRKNEIISILKQLAERNQIEFFGGGYYSPILPLLYPVDRNGQIDLLSAEIRQTFGKRPRGISFFADCWDSSLVNNVHTCGLDYVVLDSTLIPNDKQKYLPIIMTDLNKSVDIFPYYDEFIPSKEISVQEYVSNIIKNVEKIEKKDVHFQLDVDRIINISLSHKNVEELCECKWFDTFDKYLKERDHHLLMKRVANVVDNFYSNERKKFVRSLRDNGLISSKMCSILLRKESIRSIRRTKVALKGKSIDEIL